MAYYWSETEISDCRRNVMQEIKKEAEPKAPPLFLSILLRRQCKDFVDFFV